MKTENTIERRRIDVKGQADLRLERRAEGLLPKIVGYSAVFGVDTEINSFFGSFKERIQKGAFRRAIREKQNVRALRNHDPDNLLGTIDTETLRLKEDDRGLWIEVDPPETQLASETVELIKRGDLSGMSFAFIVRKDKWINGEDGSPDLRIIQDVDMYDVGPVTYPAYVQTTTGVRSADEIHQRGMEQLGKPVSTTPKFTGGINSGSDMITGGAETVSGGAEYIPQRTEGISEALETLLKETQSSDEAMAQLNKRMDEVIEESAAESSEQIIEAAKKLAKELGIEEALEVLNEEDDETEDREEADALVELTLNSEWKEKKESEANKVRRLRLNQDKASKNYLTGKK